jgi:hypothetical protein
MNKKNLRRISVVVTAQTLWHLNRICAMNGWASKDIGRVIDKLVRAYCAERGENGNRQY